MRKEPAKLGMGDSLQRLCRVTCCVVLLCVGSLKLVGLTGCRKQSDQTAREARGSGGPPWFEEVAGEVGIDFILHSGRSQRHLFPEIMVGGIGLCDFNSDGFLDVYLVQGGAGEAMRASAVGFSVGTGTNRFPSNSA